MSKSISFLLLIIVLSSCKKVTVVRAADKCEGGVCTSQYRICTSELDPAVALGVRSAQESTNPENEHYQECVVASCQNGFVKVDASPLDDLMFREQRIEGSAAISFFDVPAFYCAEQVRSCNNYGIVSGKSDWSGIERRMIQASLSVESASEILEEEEPFWRRIGYSPCYDVVCQEGFVQVPINEFPSELNPNEREFSYCTEESVNCYSEYATEAKQYFNNETNNYGSCEALSCQEDYSLINGSCLQTTRECEVSNGVGTQTLIEGEVENAGEYDACTVSSCNEGFTQSENSCMPEVVTCPIPNGIGTQIDPGTCMATSCDPGYINMGSFCMFFMLPLPPI